VASIAKEEGVITVHAFAEGEETAIKVETNRSDQWAQILLTDWHTGNAHPVKRSPKIVSGKS
jgi:two-component sensor histidine kinase